MFGLLVCLARQKWLVCHRYSPEFQPDVMVCNKLKLEAKSPFSLKRGPATCRGSIEMILFNYWRVHKTIGRSEFLTQSIFG